MVDLNSLPSYNQSDMLTLIDPVPLSELAPENQTAGVLRCTDEDGDDVTISLAATGNSDSMFDLRPYGNSSHSFFTSGAEVRQVLRVRDPSGLDFESLPDYDTTLSTADPRWPTEPVSRAHKITLNVEDASGSGTFVVDLPLRDANEEPTVTASLNIVAEDAPVGTVVGTVVVMDPDAGDSHEV